MTVAKRALLAVAIACVAPGARAIGLGSLELHSALNQPLHATVTLRDVNMDALDEVSARIAPADRYAATDLVRDDYLRNLRLAVERIDGRPVVTVRGASALREPVIDLLIEVQQGRQSVQRAYTLLVDPPRTAGDPEPVESAGRAVDPAEGMPADAAPAAATAGTDAGSGADAGADAGAASPAPTASSTSGASADAGSAASSAPDTTTTEAATPAQAAAEPTAPAASPATESDAAEGTDGETRFFTTPEERQLDPELLVRIGEGGRAAQRERSATTGTDTTSATTTDNAAATSPPVGGAAYTVSRGDTLWRVAERARGDDRGVTMEQQMLAIVRANPRAFENGQATNILLGARIRIPDRATVRAIDPALAQRRMTALVDGSMRTGEAAAEAGNASGTRSTPAPSASTPSAQRTAQAPSAPRTDSASAEPVTPVASSVQQAASGSDDDGADDPVVAGTPDAGDEPGGDDTDAPAADRSEADAVSTGPADAEPAAGGESGESGDGTAEGGTVASDAAEGAAADDVETAAGPGVADADAPADASAESGPRPQPVAPSGGFPMALLLAVAAVLLLAGGALWWRRRQAAADAAPYDPAPMPETPEPTAPPAAGADTATDPAAGDDEPEPESLESAYRNAMASSDGDSEDGTAVAAADSDGTDDDPLADADFRIAYGMYADAVERLEAAIARDPDNAELRLKLAEVYHVSEQREDFLEAADAASGCELDDAQRERLAAMADRIAPDSRHASAAGGAGAAAVAGAGTVATAALPADEPEAPPADDLPAEAAFADATPPAAASDDHVAAPEPFADTAAPEGAGAFAEPVEADGADAAADETLHDVDPEEAEQLLDFDLGDLEPPTPVEEPTSPPAFADSDHVLDFDTEALAAPAPAKTASGDSGEATFADAGLDFDLDDLELDDGATAGQSDAESTDTGADPFGSADDDAFDLADFSLDDFDAGMGADDDAPTGGSPEAGADAPPASAPDSGADDAGGFLDLPAEEPAEPSADSDDFDIAGLEVEPGGEPESDPTLQAAGRLDLARAYADMGEAELARPLLQEVVDGGDAQQRQEAEQLLASLG
ncbi:FimV/HubP family polar landmark protein [Algiphilus sp.]|uniref:FimV/HubP family polar landmark protein n=1 Tax=Algiphilus sp. TaxID=1872431 RepID=UPI0025BE435A|nr:FimV/HubP family polar landmark protein [Algiphilus sp.]MCK5770269.1 hypothetical protein [Algiphilus sp.]